MKRIYVNFYKQSKMFEQGDLVQIEENIFFEIVKIIQKYKYEN